MAGRKAHVPTAKDRMMVQMMALNGGSQESISRAMKISKKTLMSAYREEMEDATNTLVAKVTGALLKKCLDGDTTAQIFFLKCKGKWNQKAGEVGDDKEDWLKAYAMEMTAHLKAKHDAGP